MNQISHPEMVAALAKPGADVLASLTPETANLWHAATGIAGEGAELLAAFLEPELDVENVVEEIGDLQFYLEQLRQAVPLQLEDDGRRPIWPTTGMTARQGAERAAVEAGNVLDVVKKAAIYNKSLDVDLLSFHVRRLGDALAVVTANLGVTFTQTLDHNIAKLSVRYAGLQYTDEAAQARADKAN